jgi:hypothetical protein
MISPSGSCHYKIQELLTLGRNNRSALELDNLYWVSEAKENALEEQLHNPLSKNSSKL